MGAYDFNHDGLDDVISTTQSDQLVLLLSTESERYCSVDLNPQVGQIWSLSIADMNNDQLADIFVAGLEGICVLINIGNHEFERRSLEGIHYLPQSSNMYDLDQDGDLDIFLCNDLGENLVYKNDGLGHFTHTKEWFDFYYHQEEDYLRGNYGSVFCDYNRDGVADLYIAKCAGSAPAGDPVRDNQLWVYSDSAGYQPLLDQPILNSNAQSWTSDFVDVDNDGDWDLLVVNHDVPAQLFIQNEEGIFSEEAVLRGIDYAGSGIQIVSSDFDNDGDVDILITGGRHQFYENDGTGYFTSVDLFGHGAIHSAVVGDFNGDGWMDIQAAYGSGYNEPSKSPNLFWTNQGQGRSFIKLTLRSNGTRGVNSEAIGTLVEIFHGDRRQMRELRSGMSYGVQNSITAHFGLDHDRTVDSILIFWPDGRKDTLYQVEANRHYLVQYEGQMDPFEALGYVHTDDEYLCPNDSTVVSYQSDFPIVLFNGQLTDSLIIDEENCVEAVVNVHGLEVTLPTIFIGHADTSPLSIEYDLRSAFCPDDSLLLYANRFDATWSNGDTAPYIYGRVDFPYFITYEDACGNYRSDTITVFSLNIPTGVFHSDTVRFGHRAILNADDEMTIWAEDIGDRSTWTQGSSYEIQSLTVTDTIYANKFALGSTYTDTFGIIEPDAQADYHHPSLNAEVSLLISDPLRIDSISVYCKDSGPRTFLLLDENRNQLYKQFFVCDSGKNVLPLSIEIKNPGYYQLTTDSMQNRLEFGHASPNLLRQGARVTYPLSDEKISLLGNNLSSDRYYYFYDWRITTLPDTCMGEWTEVYAVLDSMVSIENGPKAKQLRVFPNPSSGVFIAQYSMDKAFDMHMYDVQGREVWSQSIYANTAYYPELSSGYYFFIIESNEVLYRGSWILIH